MECQIFRVLLKHVSDHLSILFQFAWLYLQTKNEKTANAAKTCVQKVLRTRKKNYAHKIAAVDLSKIYLLKKAKKTCKPNNRDLDGDVIKCINYDMIYKSNS